MSFRRDWLLVMFSGWSVLTPDLAGAQPSATAAGPAPEPAAPFLSADYRPHRGVYVAAHLGAGNLRLSFPNNSVASSRTYTISGTSVPVGLELGIAAAGNLVVFVQLYDVHIFTPISDYDELDTLDLYGFGPGLKYYFVPRNVFLSSSLWVSQLRIERPGSYYDTTTHWGAVGRLSVGGEWWVSHGWAIGVAGEAMYGRIGGKAYGSSPGYEYTATGLSLLVSGSYSYPAGHVYSQTAGFPEPGGAPEDAGQIALPSVGAGGYHAHDGFYMSARVGLGWLWTSADGTAFASGSGYPFGLSAGYVVARSLIAFGEFYDLAFRNPSSGDWNNLEFLGFGPGVKYYLPWNIFVSGSLLISRFHADGGSPGDTRYGYTDTSQWGLAGRFSAGKEWWVSANWGVGIAVEGFVGRMAATLEPWEEDEYSYTVKGFSLLASASFN
jgi:hypothetical protein